MLTGALTIKGEQMIFGVWHPELVALRASLGLPRYPVQVVATRSGHLEITSALIYNVPEVQVVILTGDEGRARLAPELSDRPWITVLSGGADSDVTSGLKALKEHRHVNRVSCVGGRTLVTPLLDAGIVNDIYLTTSSKRGGEPDTPFYTGSQLRTTCVVRKRGLGADAGITFEHLRARDTADMP